MKPLLLLLLLPLMAHAQIINSSFEDWYTDSLGQKRLVGWQHTTKYNLPTTLVGTSPEVNSQHLNYAIKLSRWYDYTWDKIIQKTAISFNPGSLTGYYKYTENELTGDRSKDTAYISVFLIKWNAVQGRTDTIGKGYIELGPSALYSYFECPVQYFRPGVADSLILDISPSKWEDVPTYCSNPGYCSFLTLDNLSLKGTGALAVLNTVFPNPASNEVSINLPATEKGIAFIYNALGQLILRQSVLGGNNTFRIGFLKSGVYFMRIVKEDDQVSVYKFLKN